MLQSKYFLLRTRCSKHPPSRLISIGISSFCPVCIFNTVKNISTRVFFGKGLARDIDFLAHTDEGEGRGAEFNCGVKLDLRAWVFLV